MTRLFRSTAVFLLMTCGGLLRADVFSLFPFRSGAVTGADSSVQSSPLWTEQVDINGRKLDLQVALVNKTMEQALRDLRGQFKQGAAAANSNSLLFEIPLDNGARKRYFLVSLKGMGPMLLFSLVLPPGFRNGSSSVWPAELPLPPGAMPGTVMRLPKRHSVYGMFNSPFPPQQSLSDLTRLLEGQGWKSMGRESRVSPQASGEIFLRDGKNEIMVISVQPAASGDGSTGSLYLRKIGSR